MVKASPTLTRSELARRLGVTLWHVSRLVSKEGLSVPRSRGGRPRTTKAVA